MKEKKSDENKPKSKNKLFKIIGISFLTIIIITAFTLYFLLKTPGVDKAYLSNFNGEIQVYTKNSWNAPIQNQELSLNDKIKTGSTGSATLVLMEKAIITIEPDSEIEISNLAKNDIKIKQTSGSTWNKFLGILGIDTYAVEIPNAVASVRGTDFKINLNTLIVAEGIVNYKTKNDELNLNQYEKAQVIENEKIEKQELTREEKIELIERKKQVINDLKNLRTKEISKNKFLIDKVKSMYSLTDSDIDMYLEKIDNGELNDTQLIEKSPFKTDSLIKIKKINDEVKKSKSEITELETSLNTTQENSN